MKKIFSLLLVLAFVFAFPFNIDAAVTYKDVKSAIEDSQEVVPNDADHTATYNQTFYIQIVEGTLESGTNVTVTFTYPKEAKDFSCGNVEGWTAAPGDKSEGKMVCNYTPNQNYEVTDKLAIGTFTMTLADSAADCTIGYELNGNTGKINPPTGSAVSYIIVGSGILAAVVAFAVSKKKSKLYNI